MIKKMLVINLLLGFAGVGALAYLGICVFLLLWQNRLIFIPTQAIEYTPTQFSLPHEEVWLPVESQGQQKGKIHGWWLPSNDTKSDILLFLHGNGGNISSNLKYAQIFHQLGFSILMIDYRGYGQSQGNFPTEKQVYQDAQIAWDYLVDQKGVNPQQIIVYGHSLGGAIAIELARENPNMAGLIVEGSFTSMKDMVTFKGEYTWFPIDTILTQRFDSLDKVNSLSVPLLLIHGEQDTIVPSYMSESLFTEAVAPKRLLLIPDASHNDVPEIGGEKYVQSLQDFYQWVMEIVPSEIINKETSLK